MTHFPFYTAPAIVSEQRPSHPGPCTILDYLAAVFSTELLSNASSDWPQTEGFMNLFSYAEQVFALLQMSVFFGVAVAVAYSSPTEPLSVALRPSPSHCRPNGFYPNGHQQT